MLHFISKNVVINLWFHKKEIYERLILGKISPDNFLKNTPWVDGRSDHFLARTKFPNGNIKQAWTHVLYFLGFAMIGHPQSEPNTLLPKKTALRASPCHTHGQIWASKFKIQTVHVYDSRLYLPMPRSTGFQLCTLVWASLKWDLIPVS